MKRQLFDLLQRDLSNQGDSAHRMPMYHTLKWSIVQCSKLVT